MTRSVLASAQQLEPKWPVCKEFKATGCTGVRVAGFERCLAHLTPHQIRRTLEKLTPGADLDARGTTISTTLLAQIIQAVSTDNEQDHKPEFGNVHFEHAKFDGPALFDGARFEGSAWFSESFFAGDASFTRVVFDRAAWFDNAYFTGTASFSGARFERAERIGPLHAEFLGFDAVVFVQNVTVEAAAGEVGEVVCDRARFEAGAALRLLRAQVSLRGAVFGGPTSVAAPILTSLQGADVADLVITDADMSRCRFAGSYHLDQLRLEGYCIFDYPPAGWHFSRHWPLAWRWTSRQIVAEERLCRSHLSKDPRWRARQPEAPGPEISPQRIASQYRALRKSFEDHKNEPGAADFYYGEMEMRRHSGSTPWTERFILHMYWLLSGYGLRASRALAALCLLLILGTITFTSVGFAPSEQTEYTSSAGVTAVGHPAAYLEVSVPGPRPGWMAALIHSSDSATSLLRSPQTVPLTGIGFGFEIALRFLGPLLLGLALLAVRNRVKR